METLIELLNFQPFGYTDNVMDPAGIRMIHLLLLTVVTWLGVVLYKEGRDEKETAG